MLIYRSHTPPSKIVKPFREEVELVEFVPRDQLKIRKFLREVLPSFCWQHMTEILTMVEAEYEDVNVNSLKQSVCQLARRGALETKVSPYQNLGHRGIALMYRRRG